MRKFWILLLMLVAGCSTVNLPGPGGITGHDDYNSIYPLPANTSSFLSDMSTFLSKENAAEETEHGWGNFVVSGCLGATGASLTMTPSSCTAYNANIRGTETGSIIFPDASTCWVAMDENTSGNNANLANFIRAAGTHYLTDCIDAGQPAMASDSQLLMEVTTAGGAITTVVDKRTVSLTVTVESGTLKMDLNANSHKITSLAAPAATGDALSEGHAIGAVTPAAGAFTTLSASSTVSGNGFTSAAFGSALNLSAPPIIGGTTPAAVTSTNLTASGAISITGNQTNGADQMSHVNVNGVINVQAYGAKGDGATDDTAAIQAAVTAACPSGTCIQALYFPKGKYKVTQLNFTGLNQLRIYGDSPPNAPISAIDCEESTNNSGICADFSGSYDTAVNGLYFGTSSGHAPRALVLHAKATAGNPGFVHSWRNDSFLQSGGDFGVVEYGGEEWECDNCYFNGAVNKAGVLISDNNTPGISSPFITTQTPPSSMTLVHLLNGNYSSTGTGAPIVFDSAHGGVSDGIITGYCNSPNGVPCITDYSSTDTDKVANYTIQLRHEPQGSNPGALIKLTYQSLWGVDVRSVWSPAAATVNPAFSTAALLNWAALSIQTPEGLETSNEIVCTGSNVLGVVIRDFYTLIGNQQNNCPGASETYGIFGQGNATGIKATAFATAPIVTSQNGTSGTAACSESMQGTLKIATCYLNGYAETGSAQTYSYPVAFSTYPTLVEGGSGGNSCGTYNPSTSASVLTLPANAAMGAETCTITVIGQ